MLLSSCELFYILKIFYPHIYNIIWYIVVYKIFIYLFYFFEGVLDYRQKCIICGSIGSIGRQVFGSIGLSAGGRQVVGRGSAGVGGGTANEKLHYKNNVFEILMLKHYKKIF